MAWVVRAQSAAQGDLDRGRAALEAGRPEEAREFLDRYLAVRPGSGEAHFRTAQAARRLGDPAGAERHLDRAAELGWDPAGVELERALAAAAAGDLRRVEGTLLNALAAGRADVPDVLAVLVPAYAAQFRWTEAYVLTDQWIGARPSDPRAWAWRGEVCERRRLMTEAVEALRTAARLDPGDRAVRLQLARLMVEVRRPAEAAGHLDWLRTVTPGDPAVLLQLALCREAQGNPDEAADLLDQVIAADPTKAAARYHRGRLELNLHQPAAAVSHLRRAAELDPSDPEILNSLAVALEQTGAAEEAQAVQQRRQRAADDLKRVAELVGAIAAAPHDPDLRRQVGELFLRNGREADGLRWLASALREQPDHPATHQVLAEYYDRIGRSDLAHAHRPARTK